MRTTLIKTTVIAMSLALSSCATMQAVSPVQTPPVSTNAVSEVKETKDLASVVDELRNTTARTLVVFDIDDTTLTAEQFFGSDYWYEWQKPENLGKSEKVSCKFDYIALNFEAQTMKPTQQDAAAIFNGITHDKLFLTSRGANYRGPTIRELTKNGIAFPKMLDGNEDGRIWNWQNADGSRKALLSYHEGVFMTTGQDKGVMLLFLLDRMKRQYDRVILVDDGMINITNMQRSMKAAGINYTGLHYTLIDKPFPINPELAKQADDDFDESRRYLKEVFPTRYEQLQRGECSY